jgi:hypothetical protein
MTDILARLETLEKWASGFTGHGVTCGGGSITIGSEHGGLPWNEHDVGCPTTKTKDAEIADLKAKLEDAHATITSLNDERTALHLGADERDQLRADLERVTSNRDQWSALCIERIKTVEALNDKLAEEANHREKVERINRELAKQRDQLRADIQDRLGTKEDAFLATRMADAARAELAEANALLTDVAINAARLTFNSWWQTNYHRFCHLIPTKGGMT